MCYNFVVIVAVYIDNILYINYQIHSRDVAININWNYPITNLNKDIVLCMNNANNVN
jgi:hypothetical protein